jgi:hypothetical protein
MWAAVIRAGGNDTLANCRADSLYGKGGNDQALGLAA